MEYIWVLSRITGAGSDFDTVGFYDTDISARNAVESVLSEAGRKWTNYVYYDKTEMHVHVPYFLQYKIIRQPKNWNI